MAQYLGQIGGPSGASLITKALTDPIIQKMQQDQQQKQEIAKAMIQNGQYQPVLGGQQPGVMQKLFGNGPQVGQPTMNMGGQNFQYQTPEIQAQKMQAQMDSYRKAGLIAPQGQPQLGSAQGSSSAPFTPIPTMDNGKMGMKMQYNDPNKQLEAQKTGLEIAKLQKEQKQQDADNVLYSQSPEDIKAYVKKNNPALARVGESIIAGKTSLQDISMRDPAYKKQVTDYVTSQGLNEQDVKARAKVRNDYTPGGTIGKQLTTAGTIVQHMSELDKTIDELHDTDFPLLNRAMQTAGRTFGPGSAALKQYDTIKNALGGEIDKYYRAGGSAEGGIDRIIKQMDEADTPEAQKAALHQAATLMSGRLGQYVDGWRGVYNRAGDPDIPNYLLSDRTKSALNNMGMSDTIQRTLGPSETQAPEKSEEKPKKIQASYTVGQIIPVGNKKYKVTGGDPSDPDIEEVK